MVECSNARSVSQWIRESHVALDLEYALELVRDYTDVVREVRFIDDGEEYVVYKGLDELFIAESLFCSISDEPGDTIIGRNHYLYLMDCYDFRDNPIGVIKVGVSRFPSKRMEQLNVAWERKRIRFKVRKVDSGSWSKRRAYGAEAAIHTVLRKKGLQWDAGCKYDGFSELFYDKDWIEEMI